MTINYDFGEHEAGETVKLNIGVKNDDGILVDPDTITISVRKPSGSLDTDGILLTKDGIGDYHYYYTISLEIGDHRGRIKATSSEGKITMRTFELKAVRSI